MSDRAVPPAGGSILRHLQLSNAETLEPVPSREESPTDRRMTMIGTFVTFRYRNDFNEAAIRKIADGAKPSFEGMPGLRFKAFTVDAANREAVNFYVWDSEAAARGFFTEDLLERVTGLYGERPTIRYVDIATLVDNAQSPRRR